MLESWPSTVETGHAGLEESYFRTTTSVPGISKHRGQRMASNSQISSCSKNTTIFDNNNKNYASASGEHELVQSSPESVDNGRHLRGGPRSINPGYTTTDDPRTSPQATSGGRKAGTSKYFGVRFRTDLNKWVAEIRVAEWKAVDRKVWLGTFESEKAAARGVDLARKLLKCAKKHAPNLPCAELAAYSKQIPANLDLTELTATGMFKQATLFIKAECKAYAASFDDDNESASAHATRFPSTDASPFQGVQSSPGCSADSDLLMQGLDVPEYSYVDDFMAMTGGEFTGGQWMDPVGAAADDFDDLGLMSSPCSSYSSESWVPLQPEWPQMSGTSAGGYGCNFIVDHGADHAAVLQCTASSGTMLPPQQQLSAMIEEMEMASSRSQQQWEDEIYRSSNWPVLPLPESSYPPGQFLHAPADSSASASGMAMCLPSILGNPWPFPGDHFQLGFNPW